MKIIENRILVQTKFLQFNEKLKNNTVSIEELKKHLKEKFGGTVNEE